MSGLIADIGGTNARFALIDERGAITSVEILQCNRYATLTDACQAYLHSATPVTRPVRAAFAVASPVIGDRVSMTNHLWSFSIEETRQQLRLQTLNVVNDFVAVVVGIPHLVQGDTQQVGGGCPVPAGTIGALGAGTGLGMASLVRTADGRHIPISGEGGHCTLAASTEDEAALLALLRRRWGHVSAERVLSGPGLVNLYEAVAEYRGLSPDPAISPPECTRRALDGSCAISQETVEHFCRMLGTVASNLALVLGASGGIYIGGGIVPQLGAAFVRSDFRARFEDKGRFAGYLAAIPTLVITRPLPAFVGLAALAKG